MVGLNSNPSALYKLFTPIIQSNHHSNQVNAMINTVWGSTDKPVSSKQLAALLTSEQNLEGTLYIGYPIIGTPEGSFPVDALLVSPTKGLVLFNLVEGRTLEDFESAQDEGFNKMQAKLFQPAGDVRKSERSITV